MARVKLAYPKIPGSGAAPLGPCIAFEKYDGTNLHWVWDEELSWHAFGTRRNRFDFDDVGEFEFATAHPELAAAPEIFRRDLSQPLEQLFLDARSAAEGKGAENPYHSTEITVFTEFLGVESFAGRHHPDDPKRLILFDVETNSGMIGPTQFIQDFATLPIATVVYQGPFTGKFAQGVREGQFGVDEGVVCKGLQGDSVWMAKIKTNAYMKRLKEAFQDRWEDYWE